MRADARQPVLPQAKPSRDAHASPQMMIAAPRQVVRQAPALQTNPSDSNTPAVPMTTANWYERAVSKAASLVCKATPANQHTVANKQQPKFKAPDCRDADTSWLAGQTCSGA
jgi:hypothetical protein